MKAIKIMDSLRQTLPNLNATVHNIFSDIRIISGNTEGRYGWVAANYLDKKLGDPSGSPPESEDEMMGMLDLGGASTQIAFVPANGQPAPHTLSLNLFGATYDVYSYSFLCFGKEAFIARYLAMRIAQTANITEGKIYSPCHLAGYQEKIDTGEIFAPPCVTTEVAEELTGLEIVPPEAFSGFAYAIEFFEFPTGGSNLTRTQVKQAVDLFCQRKWSEVCDSVMPSVYIDLNYADDSADESIRFLRDTCIGNQVENEHPSNELKYVAGYCFAGIYIDSLLNGYGFSEDLSWKNINFVKEIADTSASWALGYMVDATGHIESLPSENDLYELLLVVSMIVLCLAWFLTLISLLFTS
ncbi:unnamed protein product [Dibothriocephalus latus]|uniref:Ectonucleoside triphosphate diphosphohydrolase 1 n=1 Tax=Dibothriocephalus latus TaxID=60516 RepID=A0A3P6SXW7_DIBLA|nr:unnamed protein product [Dibothriocephalus latus]